MVEIENVESNDGLHLVLDSEGKLIRILCRVIDWEISTTSEIIHIYHDNIMSQHKDMDHKKRLLKR